MNELKRDKMLVKKALAGDRQAFDALVDCYYDMMYCLAYRWAGDQGEAEDITHNAFLKMAENLENFGFRSSFKTWLYRIVVNTAKDHHRQQGRFYGRQAVLHENLAGQDLADNLVLANDILALVERLPETEKETFLLVAGQGLSHREAADILGCKENTISWRMHNARNTLKGLIGEDYDHDR